MSHYFFHVKDGELVLDEEGVELPDLDAVRAQAVIASGTMIHDHGAQFWNEREWRMWVTDEAGATVCGLRLSAEIA